MITPRLIALLVLATLTADAAPQKVYEVVLKDVSGPGLILELAFYSGNWSTRASQKKIMTRDESDGVKTTVTDTGGYLLEVSEHKTLGGIKPEGKWLNLSLVYSTEPPLQEAYNAMLFEIEKMAHSGVDISAYVKIGDKNIKTSQEQMKDPSGGFVFMTFDAASKIVYRKNTLLKTIQ